ncbi:hypothetical protein Gotur_023053 [Gossypium turneri]
MHTTGESIPFKGDADPDNKGINDPEFGAYSYGDDSENLPGDADPDNKGVNDPEFGAYWYRDDSENLPVNRKALGGKSFNDYTATKETIYFFEDTLLPGTKLYLQRLLQESDTTKFLPRQIAESTPLTNDELSQILKKFSLKSESKGASYVKNTVKNCERPEMRGETKYCATSLETFVDSGVSILGKNIKLLSNEIGDETKNPSFKIGKGVRTVGGNEVVCHKMTYPHAVYLCHSIEGTEVYQVPLVSDDGTKAKAMAVCHKDTSAWSPNHIAFKILKVKPGTVPICHFLGRDTLVWVSN